MGLSALHLRCNDPGDLGDGQVESAAQARQPEKAVSLVKSLCPFIFGIHNKSVNRDIAAKRSTEGVEQQGFAEPLPTPPAINGEAAHQHSRNERISRELPGELGREVGKRNTGSRKCVITCRRAVFGDQDKA